MPLGVQTRGATFKGRVEGDEGEAEGTPTWLDWASATKTNFVKTAVAKQKQDYYCHCNK